MYGFYTIIQIAEMVAEESNNLHSVLKLQVPADDQCTLCGQLMGMSEFLCTNISKSTPRVFKFEKEKFAIKKTAAYSLVLVVLLLVKSILNQVSHIHVH